MDGVAVGLTVVCRLGNCPITSVCYTGRSNFEDNLVWRMLLLATDDDEDDRDEIGLGNEVCVTMDGI